MSTIFRSSEYREWAKSYDSDDPLVMLVTLSHPSLSVPVRVSSDATTFLRLEPETKEPLYGTISNGNEFLAYPFSFVLPDQPENSDQTAKASFRIDNIDRQLTQFIRDTDISPKLSLQFCFAKTPNKIIEALPPFVVTSITYDEKAIDCQLSVDDFRLDVFPYLRFYPSIFPGLFSK